MRNGRYFTIDTKPLGNEKPIPLKDTLQNFDDDWTKYEKFSDGSIKQVSDRMRMFFIVNALVTGVIKRIGFDLEKLI